MEFVIIGNIVSLVACTLMVIIGFIKKKETILVAQTVQFMLMALSNFILGGFGGAIANGISIVRNLIIIKWKCNVPIKLAMIATQVALSIPTVTSNPITWLPIFAAGLFTWYIDTKCVIKFKAVMIITLFMWTAYDLFHLNYVSVAFDIFTIISTAISICHIKKSEQKPE